MRFLILIVAVKLFATIYPDFSFVYNKYKFIDSDIPISKNYSITFTKPQNYYMHNVFLDFYVIRRHNNNYIRFKPIRYLKLGQWIASTNYNEIFITNFARKDFSLKYLSKVSINIPKGAIISDIFGNAYGISYKNNTFIPFKYIKYFIKNKGYSYLGVELNSDFEVVYINPFLKTKFKLNDRILKINNKSPKMDYILFTNKKYLYVKIKRKNKILNIKVKVFKKPLLKYESFLEPLGFILDKKLNIVKVLKNSYVYKHGINNGKILKINNKSVKSINDVKMILSHPFKQLIIELYTDNMIYYLRYPDNKEY